MFVKDDGVFTQEAGIFRNDKFPFKKPPPLFESTFEIAGTEKMGKL